MSLSIDRSPISKVPRKRLFDKNGFECTISPTHIKCPKVCAFEEFPNYGDPLTSKFSGTNVEGLPGGAATTNSNIGKEGTILYVKPLRVYIPDDWKTYKQVRNEIQAGYVDVRNLEGNASEEYPDKVQDGPRQVIVSKELCKLVPGKSSSDCNVKLEGGDGEAHILSSSEGSLLESDFKCPMVSNIDDGFANVGGKVGRNHGSRSTDWFAEVEREARPESQEFFFDWVPSSVDTQFTDQRGKKGFDWEPTKSTFEFKGRSHKVMIRDESESLFSKQNNSSRSSRQNSTNDNSLALGAKADDEYMSSAFDNDEDPEHTWEAKESNEWGVVSFDEYPAELCRGKVKEALNLFEEVYDRLLLEQKERKPGKSSSYIYVRAAMLLKEQQKWVHKDEQFVGPVPGVEVGDQFHCRAELVVIGLHHQFISGINYIKKDGKLLATSILASDRYANETQSSDVLIYSGEGGNPQVKGKKPEDQKLERGNLALKNSMDEFTPVRVIHGRKTSKASSPSKRNSYIYDGLYTVSSCKPQRGPYGKLVFIFRLDRIPGQPKLTQEITKKPRKSIALLQHCVVDDVSQGKEKVPIRALNSIDNEKPPHFVYTRNMIYPEWYNRSMPIGCDCTNGCSDSNPCSCVVKNEGAIPFNNIGAIVRAKPIIFECGPSCKCSTSCMNRSSQRGVQHQLEIFKTESRGWGVRSQNFISSGSFVCEYVGELLREREAEERTGSDEYLFDIGNRCDCDEVDDNNFTIDAAQYGNVGRFINHSCSPNLYAQDVLFDHDDKRTPQVMLFASKNIPPLRELTYDYNYKIDQVHDAKGNIKKKNCYCGSRGCTGRMY